MPAQPIEEGAGPDCEQDSVREAVAGDAGPGIAETTDEEVNVGHVGQDAMLRLEVESAVDAEQAALQEAILISTQSDRRTEP